MQSSCFKNIADDKEWVTKKTGYLADWDLAPFKNAEANLIKLDAEVSDYNNFTEQQIRVTAVNEGLSDSREIYEKKVISVYGVMIGNCPNFISNTGDTHQLTANVAPIDATNK